jgi:hypothetical protein
MEMAKKSDPRKLTKDRPKSLSKYAIVFSNKALGKKRYSYPDNELELAHALDRLGGAGWTAQIYRIRYHEPHTITWDKKGVTK